MSEYILGRRKTNTALEPSAGPERYGSSRGKAGGMLGSLSTRLGPGGGFSSQRGAGSAPVDQSASVAMALNETIGDSPYVRNTKGGIKVDDLERVWKFMKRKTGNPEAVESTDTITVTEFLFIMKSIFPAFSAMEASWILKKKESITYEEFCALVSDNSAEPGYDPIVEAMKLLDPQNNGQVDLGVISTIFAELGVGEASKEELQGFIELIAEELLAHCKTCLQVDKINRPPRMKLSCVRELTDFPLKETDA